MGSRVHTLARARAGASVAGRSRAPRAVDRAAGTDRGHLRDPDAEFVGGAWDEDAPPSLDFDDEIASRTLHAREPGDDFATMESRPPRPRADAADLLDLVDADGLGGLDDTWDDPSAAEWYPR